MIGMGAERIAELRAIEGGVFSYREDDDTHDYADQSESWQEMLDEIEACHKLLLAAHEGLAGPECKGHPIGVACSQCTPMRNIRHHLIPELHPTIHAADIPKRPDVVDLMAALEASLAAAKARRS